MNDRYQNIRRRGRRAGFTMIELLVSMAILAILVALLGRVFGESSAAFNQGMRRSDQNLHGRAIVDFIARELGQAAINENLVLFLGDSGVSPYEQANLADSITFATPGGEREMQIVRYYVRSVTSNRGGLNVTSYELMRSSTTAIYGPNGVNRAYGSVPLPNPASGAAAIADGISGFTIRLFNRAGQELPRGNVTAPPAYADIYLGVLGDSDLMASHLQGAEYMRRQEMIFVTRVYLGNAKRTP